MIGVMAAWAALSPCLQAPADVDAKWKTTLEVWGDLERIPAGALDDAEHKLLTDTMARRTWSGQRLSRPSRDFVKRAIERKIRFCSKDGGHPRNAKDAWAAVEREVEALDRIQAAGEVHSWVLLRFLEACDWSFAKTAVQPIDQRLKDLGIGWGAYRARLERIAQKYAEVRNAAQAWGNDLWQTNLPQFKGAPATVQYKLGVNPPADFPQKWGIVLGLGDLLVNSSDQSVEVDIVDNTSGQVLGTFKLEPRAILLGVELRARLASITETSVRKAVDRLSDSAYQWQFTWELRRWGALAVASLRRVAWEGESLARERARSFLEGIPFRNPETK